MRPARKLQIYNHQSRHPAPVELWQSAADRALPLCLTAAKSATSELHGLEEIEINLVDDDTIGRIHGEFLHDPSPTDVITFPHGEIFISLDTAVRQAAENGEIFEREVALYMIHGLLHLAGWHDHDEAGRSEMKAEQSRILNESFFSARDKSR